MSRALLIVLAMGIGSISMAAANVIDTDFKSPYVNGNIATQEGWADLPETGGFSFEVDAAAGVADTAPYAPQFDTGDDSTNGHGVVLSPAIGNAVDDEWAGSMDFTLSTTNYAGTNVALFGSAHEIFDIGLSSAPTNRVNANSPDEVTIHLRYQNAGRVQVTLSKAGNYRTLAQLENAELGWDPAHADTNNANPIFETDDLNLSWTLRKSRVADTYSAVAVLSNTVSGAVSVYDDAGNDNIVVKTNAYPASTVQMVMAHDRDADDDGTKSLIHIAIDYLSVDQTIGNDPILESPILTASGGNNQVELNWTASFEATSYQVFRSTTSGSFPDPAIVTTNGTSFVDTTVVNNTTYYYFVRASETGAADADSNEVSAEPQAAATGLIVDTHFSDSDVPDYADGDINGQNRWKDAALGTSPVFAITDAAGNGFANSEPYTNNYDASMANDVYYNRIMANNEGDEWTGSITFRIKAPATPGQAVTTTNGTYDVAGMSAGVLFKVGLTANPDTGLDTSDENDIFLLIKAQPSGRIDLNFNLTSNDRFLDLGRDDAGWDPNWIDEAPTGPDFETDPITINWTIRKSTVTNSHTVVAELICGSVTNATAAPEVYEGAVDAYAADLVYFGMGVGEKMALGKDDQGAGNEIATAVKSIAVDAFSLTKVDDVQPTPITPIVLGSGGTSSASLTWEASLESASYNVYKAGHVDGPYDLLINVTELDYTDTDGLVNGTTYFYKVAAVYPTIPAEALSDWVNVRPLATVAEGWGPTGNASTDGDIEGNHNFTDVAVGNGDTILFNDTSWTGGDYNLTEVPALYALLQIYKASTDTDADWQQVRIETGETLHYIRLRSKKLDDGTFSALCWFPTAQDMTGLAPYYTATLQALTDNQASTHAAIRNGTTWYVSQSAMTAGPTLNIPDLTQELWTTLTPATSTTTNMMTVVGNSFVSAPVFNDVTAVGFFNEQGPRVHMESFGISVGEQATALQLWTDSYSIYNEDADGTYDYDGDGVVNLVEWGFVGDPVDPQDTGRSPRLVGTTGTDMVYVYPRRTDEPRPVYTVVEKENLILSSSWDPVLPDPQVGVGLWNTNAPNNGVRAVTNLVPVDVNAKFIDVQLSE